MTKSSGFACRQVVLAFFLANSCLLFASVLNAQRPRFPDFFRPQSQIGQAITAPPATISAPSFVAPQFGPQTIVVTPVLTNQSQPFFGAPVGNVIPGGFNPGHIIGGSVSNALPGAFNPGSIIGAPSTSLPTPVFDPFRSSSQPLPFSGRASAADTVPGIQVLPPIQPLTQNIQQPGLFSQPQTQGFGLPTPQFQSGLQPQNFQSPQFLPRLQTPTFQAQPLFGDFSFGRGSAGAGFPRTGQTGSFFRRFRDEFLPRLLERPRIRHTFVAGGNGNELQMNDTEFATTLTFPRFLLSEQPIRITPGFIAHFWDGPETLGPFGTGFDIPETAFSAFLTLEHFSDPNRRAGVESNFTVGVYSDYEHLDSDSLRLTGVGLTWYRLDEANTLKIGAEYFDRLELKLLPAFGLFIRPSNDLQLDLYFPRPRIAQRLPSFRSLETWWYIAGEYGGGNWTVQRDFGDDRIDINDYRAILGIEWFGQRGVTGFAETGYVFNRELVSQAAIPTRELELQDSIMVRLGLEF